MPVRSMVAYRFVLAEHAAAGVMDRRLAEEGLAPSLRLAADGDGYVILLPAGQWPAFLALQRRDPETFGRC